VRISTGRFLSGALNSISTKSLFIGISSDSEKHSKIYEAIALILTSQYPLISQENLDEINEVIKRHIETEEEMIKVTKELISQVKDPKIKLLLSAIHADEIAHHRVLVSVKENIAKALTLTEDELWNLIWKDSLWHGAPGG